MRKALAAGNPVFQPGKGFLIYAEEIRRHPAVRQSFVPPSPPAAQAGIGVMQSHRVQVHEVHQAGRGEMSKIKVAVIFGGRSNEHEVSRMSAEHVIPVIDRERYDVLPVLITPAGEWKPGGKTPCDVLRDVDVVLPLLHGRYGEDGTIQGMLEMAGVKYAGAGVLASALGMDKEYMKMAFMARGLPVTPHAVAREGFSPAAGLLGYPVFVKPARGGSSLGTSRVDDPGDLAAAIRLARLHDAKVMIEHAVQQGTEIECGVLAGNGMPHRASLPGQVIITGSAFHDYRSKYQDGRTRMEIPAKIPGTAAAEIQALACEAFDAISCEGLARVDFFLTEKGILVNEINTMPGMTPSSGFPQLWEATGLPFPGLIDRIISDALRKLWSTRSQPSMPAKHITALSTAGTLVTPGHGGLTSPRKSGMPGGRRRTPRSRKAGTRESCRREQRPGAEEEIAVLRQFRDPVLDSLPLVVGLAAQDSEMILGLIAPDQALYPDRAAGADLLGCLDPLGVLLSGLGVKQARVRVRAGCPAHPLRRQPGHGIEGLCDQRLPPG
jgi:D-alanine-D-alanine ligase